MTVARVLLESFPVVLFAAADEQWEALLREYALRGFGGSDQSYDPDEIAQAANALGLVGAAVPPGAGDRHDVHLEVPVPADFGLLQGILEDAWQLARTGQLLALPSLPEVVALRNWLCEQVTEQAVGGPPAPWRFEALAHPENGTSPTTWDRTLAPTDDVAWLVGDEHNRIIGASAAALSLLGWTEGELVGQRLLAVIPPQLREAHIAGFTRSVVHGGGDLLGVPLSVPAWTRNGSELPITLTLTRHPGSGGTAVYIATILPAPD